MLSKINLTLVFLTGQLVLFSQTQQNAENVERSESTEIYKLKPAVDIPVTAVAAGWSLYAFTKIYSKPSSTQAEIDALRIEDINGFDRWAADIYKPKAADVSDLLFYGSMPYPVIFLFDSKIRKDIGKVAFLYLESMSVTGLLYTGSVYLTDRYRPYAYNPETPMDKRRRGGAKNSFFAGHVALVATSTFFVAKVHSDYHPDSKMNWLLYTIAGGATAATAYLRLVSGQHFPSDIILGTAIGTAAGILVPHWHKNKNRESKLSVSPFTGDSHGLVFTYKFK